MRTVSDGRRRRAGLCLLVGASFAAGLASGLGVASWLEARAEADLVRRPTLAARHVAMMPDVMLRAAPRAVMRAESARDPRPEHVAPPPPSLAMRAPAVQPAPGAEDAEIVIGAGDTLAAVMGRIGLEPVEIHEVMTELRPAFDPRRLRIGQTLTIRTERSEAGRRRLVGLTLDADHLTAVRLERGGDGALRTIAEDRPLRRRAARAEGVIDGSLYASASAASVPAATLHEAIRLLSFDVDLQRDLHPGDRFEVVYTRLENEAGETVGSEPPQFVGLTLPTRAVEAYRYVAADGSAQYLDGAGRSLRKFLLKTPVDGARLSSRFGPRRHPVLGFNRMHKGIDFAAPRGTPVYAAGDGVIEVAGRNRGYGNYVRIRHGGEYATAYAHLARFARGLRRGARVTQGQVIGEVGSTGMSTGPHLHYEVLQAGTQVNPLALKAVAAAPLAEAERRRFLTEKDRIDALRRGEGDAVVAQGPS